MCRRSSIGQLSLRSVRRLCRRHYARRSSTPFIPRSSWSSDAMSCLPFHLAPGNLAKRVHETSAIAWRHVGDHPFTALFSLALVVRLINLALLSGNAAFFAETDAIGYWADGAGLANPDTFHSTLLSLTH